MGVFDGMLGAGESLFSNELSLDYSFIPKQIPYRENEQHHIASCIKPLFQQRTGRNLFLFGAPGIGKTAACRKVLQELEEQTEDIEPVYINCWQQNTTFKIFLAICGIIGYKFTQNKRGDELFLIIKQMLNKKSAVFVFDEIDKTEDFDFLYSILEEVYKKTVILITNEKDCMAQIDSRVRSRLIAEQLEFRAYSPEEVKGIIKERAKYAFVNGCWEKEALELAAAKTYESGDIRRGLYLLRESGLAAEERASKKITKQDVETAMNKLDEFKTKKIDDLDSESRFVLGIIKDNSEKKIGELFRIYQAAGGKAVYKTFQRRIAKLEKNRFIRTEKISGGADGSTSIISYSEKEGEKKLTDF